MYVTQTFPASPPTKSSLVENDGMDQAAHTMSGKTSLWDMNGSFSLTVD